MAIYFLVWYQEWLPIRNKNASAFYNHARVVNRGQITVQTGSGTTSTELLLFNFSNGVRQWKGSNVTGGPWQSSEFMFRSTASLKAHIQLTAGRIYSLYTQERQIVELSGRKRLTAQVRVSPWGFTSGGTVSAKLYIQTGPSRTWYDSGLVQLNSGTSTVLVLDISKIPSAALADVKGMGVEYLSNTNGGEAAVYLSYVAVE
jgi:mannan endo-1,4-beta-mannosidase